jgi:hypothetical protein
LEDGQFEVESLKRSYKMMMMVMTRKRTGYECECGMLVGKGEFHCGD